MHVNEHRVVVTGMGVVSPVGTGLQEFWQNLTQGVSGAVANDLFDCSSVSSRVIAKVSGFDPSEYMSRKEIRRTDRFVHFAIAATRFALIDAQIDTNSYDPYRAGVFIGSGVGGMSSMIAGCRSIQTGGMGRVSPMVMPMMLPNMATGHVCKLLQAKGPSETSVTACASGTNSIGRAFRSLAMGYCDIAFAGGTEAALNPLSVGSFDSMRGISRRNDAPEQASRPFDRDRDGFVPGEGAGMLIMERLDHALNRSAKIYGEIIGYGSSNDAFDAVLPSPGGAGAALAMRRAIEDAKLTPDNIDYINPHATSTPAGDAAENSAIKDLFGKHAYSLAISATKSMTGHMIGAAGAIEAISTLMAIRHSLLPPTINLDHPDVDCDLNYVANKAQTKQVAHALSNSFGFGGVNASIVISKYQR